MVVNAGTELYSLCIMLSLFLAGESEVYMNHSERIYSQKKFIADFIGRECFEDECVELSEYDESIAEIHAMIDYYIVHRNDDEVAYWRKMLQQTKVAKRRAKKMIEKTNRMEIAYS